MDVYRMTTKSEGMMIPGKLKWYVILALALWLAFSGVTAAEQLYVNESGWWRVDGVFNVSEMPIRAAVGAADAGDAIFVWNGSYTENVEVNKTLTLEGEGADVVVVTAASSADHVFAVTADYVNISGFAVRGATDNDIAGIYLDDVDYCDISENNVYGNDDGVILSSSSNNTLENNTVNSNTDDGIYVSGSINNTLTNNTVSLNNNGICLSGSSNNTVTNNTVKSNTLYGIDLFSLSNNNTIVNNIANSNKGDGSPNGYGISLRYDCNYNTLTNNNASNNAVCGILLDVWINYNTLTNNTVNSNYGYGIILSGSNNNTLENNNCSNNRYDGIILWSSSNNTLKSNIVSNNRCGISLGGSSNNALTNNTVNSNTDDGICLDNADNNNIACNWVQSNTERGFYLTGGSTGNNISCNNVIENGNYNATNGGWEWQFYIDQYNPVEAKHNYWGAGMNNNTIDASIYDDEECGYGEVEFYPFETEPVPCAPTPEEPRTFTTTDAVIALQIAAGSRPPDLCYDVSGDGSTTSLDALMIMQAAAGGIEIG
jgi:parallel beta-helix repeat protein